jgi:hypothetical protein
MVRVWVFALLLSASQLAAARMYMCVDEATGETSFTDRACENPGSREEIRVNPINPGASSKRASSTQKTWRSQAEVRKTGSDYNAEQRDLYEKKATASTQ